MVASNFSPVKLSPDVASVKQTGAFALMDSLCRHGVEHIFGYPGGAILPIYDELYRFEARGQLKHILVRHEQGASHAADGYARATGKVGGMFWYFRAWGNQPCNGHRYGPHGLYSHGHYYRSSTPCGYWF